MREQGAGRAAMWRSWVKVPDADHDWFAVKQIKDFHHLSVVTSIGNMFFALIMLLIAVFTGIDAFQVAAVMAVTALTAERMFKSRRLTQSGFANLDLQSEMD
jgi:hypothetical protein